MRETLMAISTTLRALLALLLPCLSSMATGQTVWDLAPNQPLEKTITGGETHIYRISMTANQYLNLVVDQRGVDVLVTALDPAKKKLTEVDSPNGRNGPEPLFLI